LKYINISKYILYVYNQQLHIIYFVNSSKILEFILKVIKFRVNNSK